jgi:hypothetical protein
VDVPGGVLEGFFVDLVLLDHGSWDRPEDGQEITQQLVDISDGSARSAFRGHTQ